MKKSQNIKNRLLSVSAILGLLVLWQGLSSLGVIPRFMLPAPSDVVKAFNNDFSLLMYHARTTLLEAFLGLTFGVLLGFIFAVVMDHVSWFHKMFYPLIILTQTIPTVALAPLLVLWMGYGLLPKITLIILTSFFPITMGCMNGFKSCDKDALNLMKSMGANTFQTFRHIKFPHALPYFFSGLKISVSYSLIGAVVAEWLGGYSGLGVYMTRVRKSYSFDKMFAVIFFISFLSLVLMGFVSWLQKRTQPWLDAETLQRDGADNS